MLFGLSLGNYALMYWANIFLARHLEIGEFDDFSVAVSTVTLLSTLATLGLEKYALRGISLFIERENWPRLRGFLRFSLRAILLFSLMLIGFISFGLKGFLAWQQADFHIAIALYTCFLPVIATCLFLIEVVTVYGQQILALALYRFFLPALFLLLLMLLKDMRIELTAASAVVCFGSAWCVTLLLMWITTQAARPSDLRHTPGENYRRKFWLRKSLPLLLSSLMMSILTSAGTIILQILHPSQATVAIYAIAMQTSALISLIGTSTNRYYLPMLVVLLERRDQRAIKHLLRKRLQLIVGFVAVFLTVIGIWGHEILDLFGPTFSQGYWALMISAGGTVFMTLFSDALYYLQFMGRNVTVIVLMSLFAACMVALSLHLGATHEATGVAIAYAAPTALLFCSLKLLANRHMHYYLSANAPNAPRL